MTSRGSGTTRQVVRQIGTVVGVIAGCLVIVIAVAAVGLAAAASGTPSTAARGAGHDSEWLGHAWVDGRKTQSDVDELADQLRDTGIHDLFVHSGPLRPDGTLDAGLIPQAAWFVAAAHAAMPGVRVQAWLGATTSAGVLDLHSATTRTAVLASTGEVLDDGFDGVHFDFEPVVDGDAGLLTMLSASHELTLRRHAILSVSASHVAPVSGLAEAVAMVPGDLALWSGSYLHEVAARVDQVAVMAYDTGLTTQRTYAGYVRRSTAITLAAVGPDVTLFIGVPAYHDENAYHHAAAETVAASLRGIRLALGDLPRSGEFGVAMYVDFAATAGDWASYHDDWAAVAS